MRHIKYKIFFAWDYEKEEKWLNEMSEKGLQLVHAGICKYIFEENSKDRFVYRLELLNNLPSHFESISYIRFLKETGVEYMGSLHRWVYFRKNITNGEFELYSDIDSKIKHYNRIILLLLAVTLINIINAYNLLNHYLESKIFIQLILSILVFLLLSLLGTGIYKALKQILKLKKDKYVRE